MQADTYCGTMVLLLFQACPGETNRVSFTSSVTSIGESHTIAYVLGMHFRKRLHIKKTTYTHNSRVFKSELSTTTHYRRMNVILTALVKRMSNVPAASLQRVQRLCSVYSACRAYMIYSHTLNILKHVQTISWPLRRTQRTPTYFSVFGTYTTYV